MRFVVEIVVVGYAGPEIPTAGSKRVGGSKLKLESSDFPANGTVGLLSEIVLTLFGT
jgi:hypothetical protein